MESILTSIKKLIGIADEDKNFDADLIMHINSVFMILNQLGVGPPGGFSIRDEFAIWSDYIPDEPNLESVKTYIGMKVRLIFDPPQSSAVIESMKALINEFEWRLNAEVDTVQESKEEIQNG